MRGALTIYRRELAGLFFQPLAWVLLCLALLLNGFFFELYLRQWSEVDTALSACLGAGVSWWITTVVLPALLTMRMISEEARTGVFEYLLTAPVADWAVVLGKALAAATFMCVVWSFVPLQAWQLALAGAPVDWGQLALGLLGAALVSLLFCSLGLLASALSSTPILAAFLGMGFALGLLLLPFALSQVRFVERATLSAWIERVNVVQLLSDSFLRGWLDTRALVAFAAWIAAVLFVCTRVVEARRWRA